MNRALRKAKPAARIAVAVSWMLLAPIGAAQPSVWTEETYEDFIDGVFDDRGANLYVSARGRIQTVNRWDLNGDGFVDLVFSNTHPLIEALDLAVYWGNGKDFDVNRRTPIPVDGAQQSAAADLDGDGVLDLVVANYSNGTWTEMDSAIYFGGESTDATDNSVDWSHPPFQRKLSLPTTAAQSVAVGDLNNDGFPDIVFAFSAGHWEYRSDRDREYRSPSRIYWGGEAGFNRERHTDIPALGATDVEVADLNGDGWLDLVFANGSFGGETDLDSYIYWGGEGGFTEENRTGLPTHQASSATVADVTGDDGPEVIFTNEKTDVSFVYVNRNGAFDPGDRLEFETHGAKDCAAADFNGDGFTDLFFSNHVRHGNRITESFLYYGSDEGFTKENRKSFETIGAWGANAADLNGDGWIDLLVSNHQEHYSYEVPSHVYWNSETGFDNSRRTPLYEHGATGNRIADLNGDGHLDLVIHNFAGRSRGDYDKNYIYFGNAEGRYTTADRKELPGRDPYEHAAADLNDDGYVDLVFANSGEAGRRANENWIYWNGPESFDPWRITGLPSFLSLGVQVADLDRDGWIDVVVCNFGVDPRTKEPVSYIYWGGEDGFVVSSRTEVPHVARACSIADLNEDGHLDLVFGAGAARWAPSQKDSAVVFWGAGTREYGLERATYLEGTAGSTQSEVADLDRDGRLDLVFGHSGLPGGAVILFGDGAGGFEDRGLPPLPVEGSSNLSIADVNRDGWLDLVFPSYKSTGPPVSRSTLSRIYYGGIDGFDPNNPVLLPTNSAAGTLVSDFNRDGYPDILFYCHREEGDPDVVGRYGDHLTDSYLYWGGPDGFDASRRDRIPSLGVHNDSGVDIGHIRDRSFTFTYTSSPHPFGDKRPEEILWQAEEPHGASVRMQLRFAETEADLENAPWTGPMGEGGTYDRPGSRIVGAMGSWLQYRAILDTVDGARSPILDRVEIRFDR